MKIDEFKNKLNGLAYTITNARSGIINVYSHNYWNEDNHDDWCFQLAPARRTVIVAKHWDKLDGMPVFVLRDLLNLITKFEGTPVKERFPEKKYRLRWIDDDDGSSNYIAIKSDIGWVWQDYGRDIFTESELEQLKRGNPRLAPAIDAMKEPVEGIDNE